MNEEICCITKVKSQRMNEKMITLTFFEFDTSVLLKVLNIWTSSQVKYKSNGLDFFKILYKCIQSL